MPPSKKKLLKIILKANRGSCGCGNLKPSEVYDPTPNTNCNNHPPPLQDNNDHEEQQEEYLTSTTISYNMDSTPTTTTTTTTRSSTTIGNSEPEADHFRGRGASKIANSFAVVKDSDDPCKDFKDSMMQMVVEKRLYSRDDLEELLNCFLELNSQCHHRLIVRAFTEIWNDVAVASKIGNSIRD